MEMFIRDQTKTAFVNVNMISTIRTKYEAQLYIIQALVSSENIILGIYKSRRKTIQVLDELQKAIIGQANFNDIDLKEKRDEWGHIEFPIRDVIKHEIANQLSSQMIPIVYQMPEEENRNGNIY